MSPIVAARRAGNACLGLDAAAKSQLGFAHPGIHAERTLQDVAVRGSDTIYAIGQIWNTVTQAVVAIDPATGAERVVSSGGNFQSLEGIAVEANGNILVTNTCPVRHRRV